MQEAGKHDIAELQFNAFSSVFYKALSTGVLIKVVWKTQHENGEFIGHVYSSNLKTQATITRNVVVKAMGSSFPFKESKSNIWVNKTHSEVVTPSLNKPIQTSVIANVKKKNHVRAKKRW